MKNQKPKLSVSSLMSRMEDNETTEDETTEDEKDSEQLKTTEKSDFDKYGKRIMAIVMIIFAIAILVIPMIPIH